MLRQRIKTVHRSNMGLDRWNKFCLHHRWNVIHNLHADVYRTTLDQNWKLLEKRPIMQSVMTSDVDWSATLHFVRNFFFFTKFQIFFQSFVRKINQIYIWTGIRWMWAVQSHKGSQFKRPPNLWSNFFLFVWLHFPSKNFLALPEIFYRQTHAVVANFPHLFHTILLLYR